MLSKERVWEMFQKTYFDSIDSGRMEEAASIFHEEVEWIHTQVWEHDDYRRSKGSDRLQGRKQVEALLSERRESMARAGIRHLVKDVVFDGEKGALIGTVRGPGKDMPFIAWFEIREGKVSRYIVAPLYIP